MDGSCHITPNREGEFRKKAQSVKLQVYFKIMDDRHGQKLV